MRSKLAYLHKVRDLRAARNPCLEDLVRVILGSNALGVLNVFSGIFLGLLSRNHILRLEKNGVAPKHAVLATIFIVDPQSPTANTSHFQVKSPDAEPQLGCNDLFPRTASLKFCCSNGQAGAISITRTLTRGLFPLEPARSVSITRTSEAPHSAASPCGTEVSCHRAPL